MQWLSKTLLGFITFSHHTKPATFSHIYRDINKKHASIEKHGWTMVISSALVHPLFITREFLLQWILSVAIVCIMHP